MPQRVIGEPLTGGYGETLTCALSNSTITVFNFRLGFREILFEPLNATAGAVGIRFNVNPKIKAMFTVAGSTYTNLIESGKLIDRGNSSTVAINSFASTSALYIVTSDVIGGLWVDVTNTNSTSSDMTITYSNALTTITGALSITDGTASGGATLAQDGRITWTAPTDQVETTGDALGLTVTQRGYWYKIVVSATLDSTVSLAQVATMNKATTTTLGIFLKKAVEYNIELNDSQDGGFEIIGQDTQGTYTLNASFIKRSTGV